MYEMISRFNLLWLCVLGWGLLGRRRRYRSFPANLFPQFTTAPHNRSSNSDMWNTFTIGRSGQVDRSMPASLARTSAAVRVTFATNYNMRLDIASCILVDYCLSSLLRRHKSVRRSAGPGSDRLKFKLRTGKHEQLSQIG